MPGATSWCPSPGLRHGRLGCAVLGRVGARGFVWLYLATLLGGAAGFALLAPGLRPMVGAWGALFGLVGGILDWSYVDLFTYA